MENRKLLSIEEAAAKLGFSYKTIGRLVETGDLSAYKIGRLRRFRESDLDEFLQRPHLTCQKPHV